MVASPPKRTARTPPLDAPPPKRLATSSPEEGELDDAGTTPRSHSNFPGKPSSLVNTPITATLLGKDIKELNGRIDNEKIAPVVYERSEDVKEKIRERESVQDRDRHVPFRNGSGRRYDDPRRRVGIPSGGDHWEPGMDRHRDREPRRAEWDRRIPENDQLPPRDRERPPRTSNWSNPTSAHGRDKPRSSRSPNSADRSLSSSTPASPSRGPHRLPVQRSPEFVFTPPHRDYDLDRRREQERELFRDSGYPMNDGHSYVSSDKHQPRNRPDEHGRYYRPISPDRHWSTRRGMDSYRPSFASHHSLPQRPSPLRSPQYPKPRTPPQLSTPPPPPAIMGKVIVDDTKHIESSDSAIQPHHLSPKEHCPLSPSSLPLPPQANGKTGTKELRDDRVHTDKVQESPSMAAVKPRKREPVRRSREEEKRVYGRTFEGCGEQSNYEVTTKLGEGTFGEVHKATQISTGRIVALKRILMHNESEGMPVTALREIKILKALDHPSIVNILDMFVARRNGSKAPLSVYMVFPYMDHDLAGLLENDRVKLQPSQIKLYMKQLLEGTEYMHRNNILHRDMKAANLLISNTGSLRIADFGLARTFDPSIVREPKWPKGKERKYTKCVVTRWYRPPELLLGARQYSGEVDMWGIGCVFGEMFTRRPILPGSSDLDQLDRIWQLCGSPNQHNWPNFDKLPGCDGVIRFSSTHSRRVKTAYEIVGAETADLLDKFLICNPRERITASQALDHEYFWTDPLPADPKTLPSYEASHEFDKRGRRAPPPPPPPHQPPPPPHGPPAYHDRRPPPPPGREPSWNGPPPPHPPYPPPHARPPPPFRGQPQPRADYWGHDRGPPWARPPGKEPPYPPGRPHDRPPYGPQDPSHGWGPPRDLPNPPPHLPTRPTMPLGASWEVGRPPGPPGPRHGPPPTSDSDVSSGLNYG